MSQELLILKAHSREIVRGKNTNTFLTFYLPLENDNGYIFLLAELGTKCGCSPQVIASLREHCEYLAESLNEDGNLQHRFEQILQSVNNELSRHLSREPKWIFELNIIIGAIYKNEFIVSSVGVVHALFLRKTQKQRFRVYDLSRSLIADSVSISPEKVFVSVLDGDFVAGDALFIASKDLHNLINVEDIHPLISTLPPQSALEAVEQYLPVRAQLSLLLFQARSEKDVLTGFGSTVSSEASITSLDKLGRDTDEVLDLERPHFLRFISAVVGFFLPKGAKYRKRLLSSVVGKLVGWSKDIFNNIVKVFKNSRKTLSNASSSVKESKFGCDNPVHIDSRENMQSGNRFVFALKERFGWFLKIRISRKWIVMIFVVFVILFVGSVVFFNNKNVRANEQLVFEAQISDIQTRRSEAQAALIYKDEDKAIALLDGAKATLDSISLDGDGRVRAVEVEREALRVAYNKARHIIEPEITVYDLGGGYLASSDSKVIVGGGDVKIVGASGIVDGGSDAGLAGALVATDYDEALVYISDGRFMEYSFGSSPFVVGINAVEGETVETVDMVHYGERLYVLTEGQIYKHQRLGNGEYGPGVAWVKDDTRFDGAQSIAIDGSVWVAQQDMVRHFDRGNEIGVNLAAISPALDSVTDIYTGDTTELLFVLDAANSRVVVFKKQGEFIGQYVDERFGTASALSVDVQRNEVNVIAGDRVLRFPLTSK